jgi:hypothetical protein
MVNYTAIPETTTIGVSDTLLVYDATQKERKIAMQDMLAAVRSLDAVTTVAAGDELLVVPSSGVASRTEAIPLAAFWYGASGDILRSPLTAGWPRADLQIVTDAAWGIDYNGNAVTLMLNRYGDFINQPLMGAAAGAATTVPASAAEMTHVNMSSSGGTRAVLSDYTARCNLVFGTGIEMSARRLIVNANDVTWIECIGFVEQAYLPLVAFDGTKKFAFFFHATNGYGADNKWHVITCDGGGALTDHGSFNSPAWDERNVWRTFRITGNADDSELYFYVDGNLVKTANTGLPASGTVVGAHTHYTYGSTRIDVRVASLFGHSRLPVYA